jgi:uncharacterized membrane protein YhaH (DUF805 family)
MKDTFEDHEHDLPIFRYEHRIRGRRKRVSFGVTIVLYTWAALGAITLLFNTADAGLFTAVCVLTVLLALWVTQACLVAQRLRDMGWNVAVASTLYWTTVLVTLFLAHSRFTTLLYIGQFAFIIFLMLHPSARDAEDEHATAFDRRRS